MSTSSVRRWLLSGVCAAAVAALALLGTMPHEQAVARDSVQASNDSGQVTTQTFEWD